MTKPVKFRCVRIWTGEDQHSYFDEGWIELKAGARGDLLSGPMAAVRVSFQETVAGGDYDWHPAPIRQLVITLKGTLDFETSKGKHFQIGPGDVLLAEDTTGHGHRWKLVDEAPWQRLYAVLAEGVHVPFVKGRS